MFPKVECYWVRGNCNFECKSEKCKTKSQKLRVQVNDKNKSDSIDVVSENTRIEDRYKYFFFFLKLPLQILISIWVVLPDWYISNIVPLHNFLQKWIRTILWFMALMLINNNEISIQIQLLEQMKIIYSNIKNYKL